MFFKFHLEFSIGPDENIKFQFLSERNIDFCRMDRHFFVRTNFRTFGRTLHCTNQYVGRTDGHVFVRTLIPDIRTRVFSEYWTYFLWWKFFGHVSDTFQTDGHKICPKHVYETSMNPPRTSLSADTHQTFGIFLFRETHRQTSS